MAKYKLRLKARALRGKGISINDICKEFDVSKSTASLWCRDIELSENQKKHLKEKIVLCGEKGREIATKINRERKHQKIELYQNEGLKKIAALSERDLLITGTALYWGEGAKTETTGSFVFSNSDPQMILIMKKFLTQIFGIDEKEISCTIQVNKIHKPRIEKILNFWSNLLKFTPEQFKKPYYVKTKPKKVYKNNDSYYGILRIRVKKSVNLKYKILGLIEGLKKNNMSG